MSSSTSRKVPVDVLSHPDIVALVEQGRQTGTVTADALRTATAAVATTPQHLKAVLRFLSEEGVSVVVSAEDTKSPKLVAAAASSARTTVKATAKKAPAKKAPGQEGHAGEDRRDERRREEGAGEEGGRQEGRRRRHRGGPRRR